TNPVSGSSLAAVEAGLQAATFSQLTKELSLTQSQQFAMLDALAVDLSDGTLDGMNGPVAIPLGLGFLPVSISDYVDTAVTNFRTNSTSASYNFSYTSQMMMGMDKEGKNNFQVNITDVNSDPVTGQNVTVMPMMYMALKTHSAAVDGNCLENAPGVNDCTVYYSMGSRMMDGSSMGEWDLKIMVGGMTGESAHFYPEVMMAMLNAELGVGADNPHIKLKNSGDTITDMDDVESARTFLLFKSSLIGTTDNHSLQLYIATMESMMSFPAVYPGVALNAGTMNQLNIDTMTVDVSTDPAFTNPISLSGSSNDGYWTSAAIQGLTNTVQTRLYVRMSINGLNYNSSIDGVLIEGVNEYATFTITPVAPAPM
ncbi:MAG: hypothetical protein KAJ92_08610, partial [Gammaproteobacteria bacterium]|nr:hypothetical protein [Gammaproteobacteria bacterium]